MDEAIELSLSLVIENFSWGYLLVTNWALIVYRSYTLSEDRELEYLPFYWWIPVLLCLSLHLFQHDKMHTFNFPGVKTDKGNRSSKPQLYHSSAGQTLSSSAMKTFIHVLLLSRRWSHDYASQNQGWSIFSNLEWNTFVTSLLTNFYLDSSPCNTDAWVSAI